MNPLLLNCVSPEHRRSIHSHVRHQTYQFTATDLRLHNSQRYSAALKDEASTEIKMELIPDFCIPIKYKEKSARK